MTSVPLRGPEAITRRPTPFSGAARTLIPSTVILFGAPGASERPETVQEYIFSGDQSSSAPTVMSFGRAAPYFAPTRAQEVRRHHAAAEDFHGKFEKTRRTLGRLVDGWAGEESVAPRESALSDLDLFLAALDPDTRLPDVEADEDTGIITLRWLSRDGGTQVSAVFSGDGDARLFVVDVAAGRSGHPHVVKASDPYSVLERNSAISDTLLNDDSLRV